nr:hypothetical protein [uncultured Undibacterium sp.]
MTAVPINSDELENIKRKIEEQPISMPQLVPVDFVSASGKLIKTINNADEKLTFSMRENEYEIRLDKPIYVTEITVVLSEFESVKGMRLVATDLLANKPAKVSITVEKATGNSVTFVVDSVITSFTLHRSSSWVLKKLNKIRIYGVFLENIEKFEQEFQDLNALKKELLSLAQTKIKILDERIEQLALDRTKTENEVQAAQSEVAELDEEKSSLESEVQELKKSVAELEKTLESKKSQDAILAARSEDFEKRIINVKSELAQKTETLANVNISISNANDKLKELTSNVNVFSEEFSGFVDQGTKQVATYLWLSVVPLALLVIVVVHLFYGAVDLSLKFEKLPSMDLLTLFATRLPFVAIAFLIVGVSVKILYFLIDRIISIHQQRLDLAKIAIIAKDVSDASAAQLEMSADELYEAKTYLKMSILRAYLSDQIGTFSYNSKQKEKTELTTNIDAVAIKNEGISES